MNDILYENNGQPTTELMAPDPRGMALLGPSDIPDLDTADEGIRVEAKYYKFEKTGDKLRAVFCGFTKVPKNVQDPITKENKQILLDAAVLQNKQGIFLHSGANLLQQLNIVGPGTAIQITYQGTERTKGNNNVNKFDVVTLNVPRANLPLIPAPMAPAVLSAPAKAPAPIDIDDEDLGDLELVPLLDAWTVETAVKAWSVTRARAAAKIAEDWNISEKDALIGNVSNVSKKEFADYVAETAKQFS